VEPGRGYFARALPGLPAAAHWANGLVAALLLFVSVLLHELAHALVALGQGLSVRGITLHVFGGVSHLEERDVLKSALDRLAVRDVMTREVIHVRPEVTVAELVEHFWRHHVTSFPVVAGGVVRGIVSLRHLDAVPRDRWPSTPVADVMAPLAADLVVDPGDTVTQALERATRNSLGRLAVLAGDRLVGYLSLKDIVPVLALRGFPTAAVEAVGGATMVRPVPGRRAA
jgi:CBS domain-containing protein